MPDDNDSQTAKSQLAKSAWKSLGSGSIMTSQIKKIRDSKNVSKQLSHDELVEKYKTFQDALDAFQDQVESNFEPSLI